MNLKPQLLELLEYAYRQEQVFVQSLAGEARSAVGTPERWSAKDTLAHIAAWKRRAAQVLAAIAGGEPGLDFEGLDQFNAEVFREHRDLPWFDVLDKSRQAYRLLREQTQATPEDVLAAPEPSGPQDKPAWWFVVGNGCTHALGHLAQAYIEQGQAAFALEMQEGAAELLLQLDGGPDWRVYYGLAGHYAAAGQPEKAIAALRRAAMLCRGENNEQEKSLGL